MPLGTAAAFTSSSLLPLSRWPRPRRNRLPVSNSADVFRFDANGDRTWCGGWTSAGANSIVLQDYARGTFHDQAGGNPLTVSAEAPRSRSTIWAICGSSIGPRARVHIREGRNDTLVLEIDQRGSGHVVQILDIAHAYF